MTFRLLTLFLAVCTRSATAQVNPVCPSPCSSPGPELVVNGDFAQAIPNNSYSPTPGFGLPSWATAQLMNSGEYFVTTDAALHNNQWSGFDHTTGSGNFLVCDGISGTGTSGWGQVVNIASYPPNTDFVFSAWVNNNVWPIGNYSDPEMQLLINGTSMLPIALVVTELPDTWIQLTAVWNSGPTPPANVTLEVVTESTLGIGNDFGIDDISFRACIPGTLITVDAGPDALLCGNDSVTLGSVALPLTYSWSPASGLSATNIPNPVASPDSTTTYILTVTDTGGCSGTDTVTVFVSPGTANATFSYSLQPCSFGSYFQGFDTTGTVSFFWDLGDGTTNTNMGFLHYFPAPGTYTVTLIATDSCGSDTSSQVVTITAIPYTTAGFTYSIDSCNVTVSFTSQSSNVVNYFWLFGDASSSTLQDPVHTYGAPGLYNVMMVVYGLCNSDTAYTTVDLTQLPLPSASFTYAISACADTVTFTNTSVNTSSYVWDFGDGNTGSGVSPVNIYAQAGTYTITLIATGPCGNDTTATQITLQDVSAIPAFTSLQDSCDNSVTFINNSSNANSFNWDFGDGQNSTNNAPDHLYPSAGTYQVTLTASNNCDSQSITQTVTAAALNPATAGFTYSTDTCLRRLQFQSTSQNAQTHEWSFGDGQTASGTSGIHSYSTFGLYTLTLVINDTQGCRAEATSLIDLTEPPPQIFIPNVFTPNGDGTNDVFEIKVRGGCSDGTYQIFSRWGDLVLESKSLHATWDGNDVPGGIYMYIAQVGNRSYKGFLEIVK